MKQPSSLRVTLLRWLVPAMVLMVFVGSINAYSIAYRTAILAYDRALLDTALALSGQVQNTKGHLTLNLPEEAKEILLTDKFDQIFYRVVGADGREIDGDTRLPMPANFLQLNHWRYYDAKIGEIPVRVAALFTEKEGLQLTILSAETLIKRKKVFSEILVGLLLPELVLGGVTFLLFWLGIRAGLRPLENLKQQLSNRSQNDLRPIATEDMVLEIHPVINELNQLLIKLDESLMAQRNFVSDAAHQLRTPIAALLTQLEFMLREPEGPKHLQVKAVLAGAERMAHLVHQLLALARAEPTMSTSGQCVELDGLIRETANTMVVKAIAKEIDLGFELNPAKVLGSELLLQEAISNLIDNAIRYTPPHGTVNVSCRTTKNGVILIVEDSGKGIPKAMRNQVFERFFRIPGSGGDGCGLGLAIVRQIARQHGAKAKIGRSKDLGGAAAVIYFPAIH
jgi:two-component system, OmpR family, sensor histidine kinase TctE